MDLARMRNLGVVAHIDAGKTTVSERILHYAGIEHRVGRVDEGTAVLDWMSEERERGITITAAATTLPWRDHQINLIDTPGHVDFTVEVERCMRVLDGAVLVLDGVMGVQAQSETVWRQMRRHRLPCIAFANKCDRPGWDLHATVKSLRKRLQAPAIPLQYPLGEGSEVHGLVDLLDRRTWPCGTEEPVLVSEERPWPAEVADEIAVLRAELLEALTEEDEGLLTALVEEREPDVAELRAALRRRVLAGTLVPVLCGAALRDVGVPPLLDAVVDYLPSPLDCPPVRGTDETGERTVERRPERDGPLAALAFKVQSDVHGDLTYVRVYSGTITPGMQLYNPRTRKKERVARILRMHADAGRALEWAGPGEIVALSGLKWTGTGDTLCTRDDPVVLERLEFPEPVMTMVLEPASAGDRDKLRAAVQRLATEDPSLRVREDEDTGQLFLAGMGELHLEVVLHRLAKESHVEPRVGQPRVAYREAVRSEGRGHGRVQRTLGGKEVFGEVDVVVAPDPEAGLAVEWAADCLVPRAFRAAVEQVLDLEGQVGPRFGYPLVHARVRVVGGASHERHDAELGFTQAAAQALRQALQAAGVDLLEPVMAFEIQVPAEFASGVIADLNARHAEVEDVRSEGELRTILGKVPLIGMFGYSTAVRSLSQGRASFSMTPADYRRVPEDELAARGLVWT